MIAEVWTFAGLVVTSLGGILAAAAALVAAARSGHARDHAAEAATAAGQARDYSEPTGDGYAKTTTSTLERIEIRLERIEARQRLTDHAIVQHLADHARADVTHHEETPR